MAPRARLLRVPGAIDGMTAAISLLLGALLLLAGCGGVSYSDPHGASPYTSAQSECERSNGVWHPSLAVCENPKP